MQYWIFQEWVVYIGAAVSVIMVAVAFVPALLGDRPRSATKVKANIRSRITEWRNVRTEDELLAAINDVKATPFGGIGQHIGYIVNAHRGMKHWDFSDRFNAAWLLQHPSPRIETNYTLKDVGFDAYPVSVRGGGGSGDYEPESGGVPLEWLKFGRWQLLFAGLSIGWPSLVAYLTNYGINWLDYMCVPSIVLFLLAGVARGLGK